MNRYDIADQEVVPAQFLAFALACTLVLFGSLFPSAFSAIAYKLADAVFITGCVLVAMKLARKGWGICRRRATRCFPLPWTYFSWPRIFGGWTWATIFSPRRSTSCCPRWG